MTSLGVETLWDNGVSHNDKDKGDQEDDDDFDDGASDAALDEGEDNLEVMLFGAAFDNTNKNIHDDKLLDLQIVSRTAPVVVVDAAEGPAAEEGVWESWYFDDDDSVQAAPPPIPDENATDAATDADAAVVDPQRYRTLSLRNRCYETLPLEFLIQTLEGLTDDQLPRVLKLRYVSEGYNLDLVLQILHLVAPTLEEIQLHDFNVTPDELVLVLECLAIDAARVRRLRLEEQTHVLGGSEGRAVAHMLRNSTDNDHEHDVRQSLSFSETTLTTAFLEELAAVVPLLPLQTLTFSNCPMQPSTDMRAHVSVLLRKVVAAAGPTLDKLNVTASLPPETCLADLAHAVSQQPQLRTLYMSDNPHLFSHSNTTLDDQAATVLRALADHSSLQTLVLGVCDLQNHHLAFFLQHVANHGRASALQHLYIDHNPHLTLAAADDDGVDQQPTAWVSCLPRLVSLRQCSLPYQFLMDHEESLPLLFAALARNPSVTRCSFGWVTPDLLWPVLQRNTLLRHCQSLLCDRQQPRGLGAVVLAVFANHPLGVTACFHWMRSQHHTICCHQDR